MTLLIRLRGSRLESLQRQSSLIRKGLLWNIRVYRTIFGGPYISVHCCLSRNCCYLSRFRCQDGLLERFNRGERVVMVPSRYSRIILWNIKVEKGAVPTESSTPCINLKIWNDFYKIRFRDLLSALMCLFAEWWIVFCLHPSLCRLSVVLKETLEEQKRIGQQFKSFYKLRGNCDMKWFLGVRLQWNRRTDRKVISVHL